MISDIFFIESNQLKDFISSINIYEISKEEFDDKLNSFTWRSNQETIESLLVKVFFDKEIFNRYKEAQKNAELIIRLSSEHEFYYFKLIGLLSYFELGIILIQSDTDVDFDSIIIEIKTLLNLESLKELGLLEKEIQFNIDLSSFELYRGNYKKALSYITNTFTVHLKFLINPMRKTYFEVLLLNLRALVNFNFGNFQDTILYLVRCLSLVKDLPEDIQKEVNLTILNTQCLIYRTIGEYELAQDFSQQLEEELSKQHIININPFELSNIYNNIGLFEAEQGNYEKSLELLNKALEIHKLVTNSFQEQAVSTGNIARLLGESGDFYKAKETFNLSLQMYDKSGSHKELVEKICWFIDVLLQEKDLLLAKEYIKMAEHYALQHESQREIILVDIRKAKLSMYSKEIADAKKSFFEVRSRADENNQYRESIQCSLYLAEISLLSDDISDLKDGLEECKRVMQLSAQTSHFVYQIRALITKAEINALLLEFNSALYAIDDALSIAEEKNLAYFKSHLVDLKYVFIEKRKLLTSSVLDTSTISKDTLIRFIRITTGKKLLLTDELIQVLEPYYLSVYVLKDTKHHIILSEQIPKNFEREITPDPLTMALLFGASIGQGNRYHEGLFVLPTPDYDNFNSIVYSKLYTENNFYLLLAFSYHKELESLYYNRNEIEKYLNRILGPIQQIEQFTTDFLKELKTGFNEIILREINLKISK